jgi:hypothetical protein
MRNILLIFLLAIPSLVSAQDWLSMVRKVFDCAPCWSADGGFTFDDYDDPNWAAAVTGIGACSIRNDGYALYRIGALDTAIQIYYNVEKKNWPGTRFYVGAGDYGFDPEEGRFYSANGKLLYEGKIGNLYTGEPVYPLDTYPITYHSNKRFEAIWDGQNMHLGETENGVKHGWGIYIWQNGDCLYGEWRNGRKCGFGMKKTNNNCKCRWSYNWTDNYKIKNME